MMLLGMEFSTCEVRLALRKFWIFGAFEISGIRIKDTPTMLLHIRNHQQPRT